MHAEIALSELHYSQDSIGCTFHDEKKLLDTARDLKNGSLSCERIPRLRVVEVNGVYHSLDNRRLWCFKQSLRPETLVKVWLFTPRHRKYDEKMGQFLSKSKEGLVNGGKLVEVRGLCIFCGNEDSSCKCVPDDDDRFDENILGDEACDRNDVLCKLAVCDHLANRQDGDDDEDPWCEQCGILKEDCACSDSWLEDRFDEELFGDFACDPSDFECITGTCKCFSY